MWVDHFTSAIIYPFQVLSDRLQVRRSSHQLCLNSKQTQSAPKLVTLEQSLGSLRILQNSQSIATKQRRSRYLHGKIYFTCCHSFKVSMWCHLIFISEKLHRGLKTSTHFRMAYQSKPLLLIVASHVKARSGAITPFHSYG